MKIRPLVTAFVLACGLGVSASAAQYDIDPLHSVAVFKISHLGASYTYGLVPLLEGTFDFDAEKPEESSIEVKATVESLTTAYAQRDRHLYSADYLDIEKFPVATFKSTAWKQTEEGKFEITGELTMLGQTKEVTIEAELVGTAKGREGETRTGFDGKVMIKRSDFGAAVSPGVGDEVWLTIGIEGIDEAPKTE